MPTKAKIQKKSIKKSVEKKIAVKKTKKIPVKNMVAKKVPAKKLSTLQIVKEEVKNTPNICHACNALPIGAVELLSVLMVVTFSLSAVLLTASYAIEHQAQQIESLQSQVQK